MVPAYWFVTLQTLVTSGLVIFLWSLSSRLRGRSIYTWWALAWTSYAASVVTGRLALPLTQPWTPTKTALLVITASLGFLPAVLLAFGARSIQSPHLPSSRWRWLGVLLVIPAGVLIVWLSVGWHDPLLSLFARLAPRVGALALALAFCTSVFVRQWRTTRSRASLAVGLLCLFYGLTESVYAMVMFAGLAGIDGGLASPVYGPLWRTGRFIADIVFLYGTCLGLLLLFIEEYEHSQRQLRQTVDHHRQVAGENLALQAEIDVRRRTEAALQQSEATFAAIFRSNPCAMAITKFVEGTILEVNDILISQSGYERSEIIGRNSDDLNFWVDPLERLKITADLDTRGHVTTREVHWRTKSGDVRTMLFSAQTIEFDQQKCVLSVAEDITERRQVEARHHAVLRALPDWMFLLSHDGVYLDVHVRHPEHLLARPADFLGKHMRDVLPPDLARDFMRCFERVLTTDEIATLEYSLPIGGEMHYYEARVVRCERDQILSVVRDTTERRRAEQHARELADELAHVGRVTTLAALTGSLAHEIRQPLAAIMTNAQAAIRLAGASPPDLAELRAALADIVSDNQRAADVVQRLRTLLRKEPPEHAAVDLNDSVAEVVKVLQRDILSKRIALALDLETDLPPVLGDRVQLQQVVLNLLVNAFDAFDQGGSPSRRVVLTTSRDDGMARLSVSDQGVGVSDDQLPKMFEPFYTTKAGGMGLGLAICQTIIAGHDGTITFDRNAEGGTTFEFSLPALASSEVAMADARFRGVAT